MAQKFDPKQAGAVLESEARRAAMPPERLLRELGVRRGMTLVDVGAGSGYFAIPAAELVGPEGKVLALDVEPEMLALLSAKSPPPWLEALRCGEASLPIADGCADFVFCCFVLHEAADSLAALRELRRVAKRRAPVVIVEWFPRRQPEGPPMQDRIHHHGMEALVRNAGLSFRGVEFMNPSQYVVKAFRK